MALFKDLIKKWFYTTSSSAASSDARVALLTASGDPKGSDTMANLASVLGGGLNRNTGISGTGVDFNTLTTVGTYRTGNVESPQNAPENPKWGLLLVYGNVNSEYLIQLYVSFTSSNVGYYQMRAYNGNQWLPWRKVYNDNLLTDSTTLSSLASALGGIRHLYQNMNATSQSINADDFEDLTVYVSNPRTTGGTLNHIVSEACYYLTIPFIPGYRFQIALGSGEEQNIYTRVYWNNAWSNWKKYTGIAI